MTSTLFIAKREVKTHRSWIVVHDLTCKRLKPFLVKEIVVKQGDYLVGSERVLSAYIVKIKPGLYALVSLVEPDEPDGFCLYTDDKILILFFRQRSKPVFLLLLCDMFLIEGVAFDFVAVAPRPHHLDIFVFKRCESNVKTLKRQSPPLRGYL